MKGSRHSTRRYFEAFNVRLRPGQDPFCLFDLDRSNTQLVIDQLRAFGATIGRSALTLAMPMIDPARPRTRGTFTESAAPAYEARAAARYLRGTALRIQGSGSSCNIVLNRSAAVEVATKMEDAQRHAQATICLVLHKGNGKRDQMIEIFSDCELAGRADEFSRLGAAALRHAASTWPAEDFSDWEVVDEQR